MTHLRLNVGGSNSAELFRSGLSSDLRNPEDDGAVRFDLRDFQAANVIETSFAFLRKTEGHAVLGSV